MTLEFVLDFTSALPEKQVPKLMEVRTLLSCSVNDLPRGNLVIQQKPEVFVLKVHDNDKGKALDNKIIKYFLPGDSEGKKPIEIKIAKREFRKKFINPKYVTVWGTYDSEIGGFITNEALTTIFGEYGTILEPVQDVFDLNEHVWSLDKKKFRIDLDRQTHIPRSCPVEVTTKAGKNISATIRITYKDQPYFCRRCIKEHAGDCPVWLQGKIREQEIREQKAKETQTLILGDSNLKRINSNAILADVVASSGAKIGHLRNQLKYEKVDNYQNLVIFGGINSIPGPNENGSEGTMWQQIEEEMNGLERELTPLVKKGKNVFLTQVPHASHTQTPRASSLRQKVNKGYNQMRDRLRKVNAAASVDVLTWTPLAEQFETSKGISEQGTINFIQKVSEKIGNDKLRATYLDSNLTTHPYSAVSTTYPLGCYKCTAMHHSQNTCAVDFSKKRHASSELDGPTKKQGMDKTD